ncbi:hypothetical protein PHISP_02191 [Aspergillus sp. HF37]|nr:hypothetical protein PHISP_02191 [Aspergillus sp. HF37]
MANAGEVRYPDTNGDSKYPKPPGGIQTDVLRLGVKGSATGPAVGNIKSEASRTGEELHGLRNSRVPSTTTATGQQLTRMPRILIPGENVADIYSGYHSLLYSLLSWEQPRATAVSFATVVFSIFAARYLPLLRWVFKFLYLSLGFTVAAEVAGRLVLSQGLAGSFRPRKYFTVPREALEATLEDLQQLLDFFLIEFQRVLFAENILHTVAAFSGAFTAYWLIKILPFWGLSLIAVTIAYLGPFFYMHNREVVDSHLEHVQSIVDSHAHQLKDLAEEHTTHATGVVKQYVGDYSAKAQEYVGNLSPETSKAPTPVKAEPAVNSSDFPEAPKEEPAQPALSAQEPVKQEPLLA